MREGRNGRGERVKYEMIVKWGKRVMEEGRTGVHEAAEKENAEECGIKFKMKTIVSQRGEKV